ncbi:bifunctional riboflavin kinase/FAD synthetase [Oscillospiraceae bacterium MB08-C2-2]|nr:bifunctional riboflavin kinase/FAD synthetase [Oscillospiraceae bacterium MB08-C2-2]
MKQINSLAEALFSQPTSVALGLFDGVHIGHQQVLLAAAAQKASGLTPVAFTFDIDARLPSKIEREHLLSPAMRGRLMAGMGIEYMICPPFEQVKNFSPEEFVEEILHRTLGAKVVCCGYNYHFGKKAGGSAQDLVRLCGALGIKVVVVEPVRIGGQLVSSTMIRGAVAAGEMEQAAAMLGRPFGLDFRVVRGRQLGRTLGFPTINQPFPAGFCLPRFGVYASRTHLEGRILPSVTNVGVKPTVGSDQILAETYVVGFEGDLYDQNIFVELVGFIRPEQRFASLEELTRQMRQDTELACQIFQRP